MTATYAMTTPAAARRASQNVSLDRTPRLSSATSASFIVVVVVQVREVRTTPLAGYSDGEIGQAKDINELIERAVIAFQVIHPACDRAPGTRLSAFFVMFTLRP